MFAVTLSISAYGGGVGEIILDEVTCSGQEAKLVNCSHLDLKIHDCDHFEDAGVICSDGMWSTCTFIV